MKSLIVVSVLSLISFSSFANTLKCIGSSADGTVNVEASIELEKEAQVRAFYSKYTWTLNQSLNYEDGQYFYIHGDSCSNQISGLDTYFLTLNGSTAAFKYTWCDDDGGSGYEEYSLTCSQAN